MVSVLQAECPVDIYKILNTSFYFILNSGLNSLSNQEAF